MIKASDIIRENSDSNKKIIYFNLSETTIDTSKYMVSDRNRLKSGDRLCNLKMKITKVGKFTRIFIISLSYL